MHESDRAFLLGLFRNTGLDEVAAEEQALHRIGVALRLS